MSHMRWWATSLALALPQVAVAAEAPEAPDGPVASVAEVAAPAAPADDFDLGDGWSVDLGLFVEYRVAMSQVSGVQLGRPLGEDQGQLEPTVGFENRLRLAGHAAFKHRTGFLRQVRLDLAADLFSGPFSSSLEDELLRYDPLQPTADLASRDSQYLRVASAEVTTMAGRVAGGRMASTWGLGILAQGAADDPLQFGFKRTGHLVNRVAYTMMPSVWALGDKGAVDAPFIIGAAYDWLVLDDRADEREDDSGNNIIALLGWFGRDLQVGAYGVRRTQQNALGLETSAWVGDLYAHGVLDVDGWKLQAATEWAVISGETEAFRSYANPETTDVLQVGGVVRFDVEKDWFVARLEGGYASGDSRPYDDTIHTMSFASDYRVGIALFPELIRRHTAVAAYNAQDPRFTGLPPVGFDDTPTRGGVTGAMYLHPVLGLRPFPYLTLLTGAVIARASEDYADVYRTALAGGTPTGPRGATHQRDLGLELDVGVRFHHAIGAGVSVAARFDAGVLFPGAVFDDADGNAASALAVTAGQVMLQGEW
ncbi:MAG: hypothetical protein AMXMBFR64_39890 [Myxococcales bacterium]